MASEKKMMQHVINFIQERGKKAVETSRQFALQDDLGYEPLNGAMKYFMDEFWFDFLHPALVSIACEAVGGKVEKTVNIGASLVLLAGAADIHDDIIDESVIKEPYPTVFGKFGRDIAILVGDALLLKGLYVLHEECEHFSKCQKQEVLESVKKAFLEICRSEAKEASWRGKMDISGKDYLDIIRQKAAAAEASTRIGAILGGGTEDEIELLSHYGRTYGVLMTLRNEFIDMFEADELKNRLEKECLPLPILLTLGDSSTKQTILQLLKAELTDSSLEKILDLSIDFKETRALLSDMKKWVKEELSRITTLKYCKQDLEFLLWASLEDL